MELNTMIQNMLDASDKQRKLAETIKNISSMTSLIFLSILFAGSLYLNWITTEVKPHKASETEQYHSLLF